MPARSMYVWYALSFFSWNFIGLSTICITIFYIKKHQIKNKGLLFELISGCSHICAGKTGARARSERYDPRLGRAQAPRLRRARLASARPQRRGQPLPVRMRQIDTAQFFYLTEKKQGNGTYVCILYESSLKRYCVRSACLTSPQSGLLCTIYYLGATIIDSLCKRCHSISSMY